MALAPVTLRVCAMMVCLLGAARRSKGDEDGCRCPGIPQRPLTKPPPETCFNDTFRYTCMDGYVRKAGTSNLIKCSPINGTLQWTKPSLICKPDPLKTTTHPPMSTATPSFPRLQMTPTGSISPGEATDTNSTEPISPGVQADHTQEFTRGRKASDQTTSTSPYQLVNRTTVNPSASGQTDHGLGKTTTGLIVCASLVIACALIGISYACYRRRSRNNGPPATEEEKISMSPVPSGFET
ncbi:interleukin-15 receptor subunit alpha isoform X2 [Scophthalmus maximus]|uniref:Sushi domain-containing protein n=1 Tax=Scophthalmus maximus TaxID=52904 RepID=A0A8D3ALK6_SCOMX|nr:interleukin-15 receptor subunit alpha isoform X2 [Scophthalmus maximus]